MGRHLDVSTQKPVSKRPGQVTKRYLSARLAFVEKVFNVERTGIFMTEYYVIVFIITI